MSENFMSEKFFSQSILMRSIMLSDPVYFQLGGSPTTKLTETSTCGFVYL
jgi:hypothetical protein